VTRPAAGRGHPGCQATRAAWLCLRIRSDSPPEAEVPSRGRKRNARASAAIHPPMTKYRRLTTTKAYPRARMPTAGSCGSGAAGRSDPRGSVGDMPRLLPRAGRIMS